MRIHSINELREQRSLHNEKVERTTHFLNAANISVLAGAVAGVVPFVAHGAGFPLSTVLSAVLAGGGFSATMGGLFIGLGLNQKVCLLLDKIKLLDAKIEAFETPDYGVAESVVE